MGEGVNETKDEKNDKFHEEQYEIYPDVPSNIDMEEGDEKDENTERLDEKKEAKGPYDNPPINMKEIVHDKFFDITRKLDDVKEAKGLDDNNDKFDEGQDEKNPDVPSPVYME